jgi:hypothetical protein
VVQRLTDLRAPMGVVVTFSFSRKVRIDGREEGEEFGEERRSDEDRAAADNHDTGMSEKEPMGPTEQGEGDEDLDERDSIPNCRHSSVYSDYAHGGEDIDEEEDFVPEPSPSRQQRSSVFNDYASADIDEDDFVPPARHEEPKQPQRSSVFSDYASVDIDEDDFVPPAPPPPRSGPQTGPSTQKPFSSQPSPSSVPAPIPATQPKVSKVWQVDPMVEMVSLRAENEDLQMEVDRLNGLLAAMAKERDTSRQEANDYRMRYEAAESERVEFLKQVSDQSF